VNVPGQCLSYKSLALYTNHYSFLALPGGGLFHARGDYRALRKGTLWKGEGLMHYSIGLKPFKEYWINCYLNTLYSVLISREPSYRFAPFLNNYTYQIYEKETPAQTKVNTLRLISAKDMPQKIGRKFKYRQKPISFRNNFHFVEYLQGLVREGKLVSVGVDLFYWIPNSVCWNKHHWDHYSLLNGFDDERKVFYVFDENILGYDEYEIPEERLRQAIQNSPVEPHGYLTQISNIRPFKFSLRDVVTYADELARELSIMNVSSLWLLSEEDFAARHMCDLFAMNIYQVVYRHKANQLLFEILQTENMVPNPEIMEEFIKYSRELQNGWNYVKGKFIQTYVVNDKVQSIRELNQKCNYLFSKECEMWSRFRDRCGK
jgi:hypothetical protein